VRRLVDGPHGSYDAYLPAVPPFYWQRFRSHYTARSSVVARPPDALFWSDEQTYYLSFARALGYRGVAPALFLPVPPMDPPGAATTIVLAPGCKTGEMAAKRWPWFPDLAARFDDVAVVGTRDDLRRWDGTEMRFAGHVRVLAGRTRLRETAELMAGAAVVVANDSGLGFVATALGVPTILLFGPTPDRTLGRFPPHVTIVRAGLRCEPCWFGAGRFHPCAGRVDCLRLVSVDRVCAAIARVRPHLAGERALPLSAS
jgi:hypothetical protein